MDQSIIKENLKKAFDNTLSDIEKNDVLNKLLEAKAKSINFTESTNNPKLDLAISNLRREIEISLIQKTNEMQKDANKIQRYILTVLFITLIVTAMGLYINIKPNEQHSDLKSSKTVK